MTGARQGRRWINWWFHETGEARWIEPKKAIASSRCLNHQDHHRHPRHLPPDLHRCPEDHRRGDEVCGPEPPRLYKRLGTPLTAWTVYCRGAACAAARNRGHRGCDGGEDAHEECPFQFSSSKKYYLEWLVHVSYAR